jgi:prolyl oligopeptidase
MVTTGDHDDRVVPAHSFKFAAELQEKQTGMNPTLIRIEQVMEQENQWLRFKRM